VIVRTIIGMAKNLGLDVLAEGVETEAQLAFLCQHGCCAFQGYLFSPPLPVADFERQLAQRGPEDQGFLSGSTKDPQAPGLDVL
jgi:EAL domain-containing protein (putative c-di-GMP-specific phosphodiesterase class I)